MGTQARHPLGRLAACPAGVCGPDVGSPHFLSRPARDHQLGPQVSSSRGILSAHSQRRHDWAGLLPRMHSGLTCEVLRPPPPMGKVVI